MSEECDQCCKNRAYAGIRRQKYVQTVGTPCIHLITLSQIIHRWERSYRDKSVTKILSSLIDKMYVLPVALASFLASSLALTRFKKSALQVECLTCSIRI